MRFAHGNAVFLACCGAWLGSQPTERLSSRAKLLVAGSVAGLIEATFVAMAWRVHCELLARHHVFQLPFLGAFLLSLGLTRAAERRARMVRAHEEELTTRRHDVASLEQRLEAAERARQHLADERKLFTRAVYNKFLREKTSAGDSCAGGPPQKSQDRPAARTCWERGPSTLQER